jgi:uncharacterized membrane protein YjgN (DUF898 family)
MTITTNGLEDGVRRKKPLHSIKQTTKVSELLQIVLKNTVFKLLTMGVYQFWATTNVRRYLWSCLQFDGDPVEWTGSGTYIQTVTRPALSAQEWQSLRVICD